MPFAGISSDPEEARDFLWALIAGAYKKDPTTKQVVGQMIVAFIPVVGQIAAARDATAYLYRLRRPNLTPAEQVENWIGLVLSLLVLVPELGAALAGVLRLAQRGGRVAEAVPWARILEVLNRLGRGNAFEFAAKYLTYEAIAARAVRQFEALTRQLDAFLDALFRNHAFVPQPALAGAGRLRQDLEVLKAAGPQQIRGAVRALVTPVERAVAEARAHMMARDGASGALNGQVRAEARAADAPAAGGVADETFGGGREQAPRNRALTPAQLEMLGEIRRAGVKFDEAKLVDVRRMPDGKLVFLEEGRPAAGLQHILGEHAADFARRGVPEDEVPDLIMSTLERGQVIGYQGKGTGRPIYQAIINGEPQPIAITTGSNGYVVGANPTRIR